MRYNIDNFPPTTEGIRQNFTAIVEVLRNLQDETEMAGGPLDLALIRGLGDYERDPLLYSQIFQQAAKLSTSPERKATYLVEAVNGYRRQNNLWDVDTATSFMLRSAVELINHLPDGARKKRLLGLAYYNAGLLFRMVGNHTEAANYQFLSASLEIGAENLQGAAISLLCGMVEKTFAALTDGDQEKIQDALTSLHTCYFNFNLKSLNDDWREFNGPVHLLETHWLAGVPCPSANELMEKVMHYSNTPKFWTDTLAVISLFNSGDYEACLQNADVILSTHGAIPSSSTADAILICTLVKARILARLGKKNEAEEEYGKILSFNQSHGGYFVKAVAKRELQSLKVE